MLHALCSMSHKVMCIFCDIIHKKISTNFLYEDERMVVFRDIKPSAPVHILMVPKTHILSVNDLTPKDAPEIAALFLAAPAIAALAGIADGYKLAVNVGRKGGQIIDHLHMHLLGGWPDVSEKPREAGKKEVAMA